MPVGVEKMRKLKVTAVYIVSKMCYNYVNYTLRMENEKYHGNANYTFKWFLLYQ